MITTTATFTPRAEMDAAFLGDILAHPDNFDDQARIYADWLDEQGCTTEAEFVRQEGPPPGSPRTKVAREYKYTLLRLRCPRYVKREYARLLPAGARVPPAARRHLCYLRARRGFVTHLACGEYDFFHDAKEWFSRNPIRRVLLLGDDPRPRQTDAGQWGWSLYPSLGGLQQIRRVLFDRLTGYTQLEIDHGGWVELTRCYDSRREALQALSRVCVAWGREKAGLGPIGAQPSPLTPSEG
jgi:uncharacterized protein (TIGR02996 family)